MIVMKFGGSSLAFPASLSRVVSIIGSEIYRHPVVVASAMGDTTDSLLEILSKARRGHSYFTWKAQEAVRNQHFAVCKELLHGEQQELTDRFLRETFRDLHVRMLELCEGEREFTPELQDWTLSLGEQWSSRLLAAILQEHCGETVHLDSRKLILTDKGFTKAQPQYWETYARLRWSVPIAARNKLVVLGGFIGSTEDGRTTTLGRGGSDLTASIVGAAINADEIQVWKDVDGMLSCDPRLLPSGHPVKQLSYEEASELAKAGATILHPETMEPAKRLRIPIVIRNTFRPEGAGTRIVSNAAYGVNSVKSIAVKRNLTVLEICVANRADDLNTLIAFCKEHSSAVTLLGSSGCAAYVVVDDQAKIPEGGFAPNGCLEVRVRSQQAILTLVGQDLDREAVTRKLMAALQSASAFPIPSDESPCSLRVAVPEHRLQQCLSLVHQTFFSHPDPQFLAVENTAEIKPDSAVDVSSPKQERRPKSFMISPGLLHAN